MKKVIIHTVFAVLVAGLASCSKPSADRVEPDGGGSELEIVFEGFEDDGTKADGLTAVELDLNGDYNPKSQVVTAKLRLKNGTPITDPGAFNWDDKSLSNATSTPVSNQTDKTTLTAIKVGEGYLKANINYKGQYIESAPLPVTVTQYELTGIHIKADAPKGDFFDGDFDDSDGIKTVPTSKFWRNKGNYMLYQDPALLEFNVFLDFVNDGTSYEKKIKWTRSGTNYSDETYSATVGNKTLELSIPTLTKPQFQIGTDYSLSDGYQFKVLIPEYTEEYRFGTTSATSNYPEFKHVPCPWSYGDTDGKIKNLIGTHTIKAKYGDFECEKTFEVIPEIGEYGTTAGTGGVGYYYYFVFDRIGRRSIIDRDVQVLERRVVQNGESITLPSFPYSTASNPDYWHIIIAGSATCTSEPINLNNVKTESEYQVSADRAPVNNNSMFLNRRKTFSSSPNGGTQYAHCLLRLKGTNLSSGNFYSFLDFNYDYFTMPSPKYDHSDITQCIEYIPPIHFDKNFPSGMYVLEVYYYNKVILSCNVTIQN